ncbi:hypothetical protein [Staphylococcus pasteuri]|uniref:hypothetical protein n=1 Tax=Staphylococcus pasteuri TaxID=45972 RepID=UPI002DB8C87D|nr:hypothetical protein [Staphylococcus pasteuri]MEB7435550.1 hypothetical protein [Staphylococcus pasteuri]
MKQFHYEEAKNFDNSNFIQKGFDLGIGWWLIGTFIVIITCLIILLVSYIFNHFLKKEIISFEKNAIVVLCAFFSTLLIIVLCASLSSVSSIGYYQAQGKVVNIDKQEKIKGKTHYTILIRFKKGNIEDKTTKPLKIKTKNRYGLVNGDKVIIKSPQMEFKGTENREVSIQDLTNDNKQNLFGPIESLFKSIVEDEETQKVPDQVEEKDFYIQKD